MKKKMFFILATALAMVGCRQQGAEEEASATDFETMTVSKQDITLEHSYPAQIEGRQSIKIIPRVEGYLRQICVKEGQRVKKGQVLFVIDQASYQAEVKAAEANVAVAKAGVETAQLNYDSRKTLYQKNVVSDYDLRTATANLAMYDAQIKETRGIVNSWEESVRAQKALMAVGEATSDEVSMAEASKLEAEETLEALQLQMIETENALCALLGRYSGHIERGDFQASCDQMPLIPQVNIQALATRPDIRQAEAALKKAFYLTNKARAALYPTLNLSGIIGWTNDADEVVSPSGLLMRTLGSLTQPVFAKGKLRAAVKEAKAGQETAKIAFHQAILKAGQEVNNVLATRQYTQRAIKQISQQVEKLTDVLDATEKRMNYDSEVNYLQVLLARQALLEARLSLLSHRYGLLGSTIQLYKALGGDVMRYSPPQ